MPIPEESEPLGLVVDPATPTRPFATVVAIGRLLGQIRIYNAVSKLDDHVYVGEAGATGAGNWAAVPHEQLYA